MPLAPTLSPPPVPAAAIQLPPLVLTVNNVSTSTTNITRCSNQFALCMERNFLQRAAGSYTFTTTNVAGCDSVATLVLTVTNTSTSTTSITRCSNQLPYGLERNQLQRGRHLYLYHAEFSGLRLGCHPGADG